MYVYRLAPVVFVLYLFLFLFFSTLFFLSWSSLIQFQVTYGWTKTLDWSKQKFYKLYKCCVPSKKKKKKKEKKNKERVWGQTSMYTIIL